MTPITGRRQAQLACALALDPRAGCTDQSLRELFWPDGAEPADPQAQLRVIVSRLASQIGKDLVKRTRNGYRLVAEPDDVDIHRFAALARTARLDSEAGRWADARDGAAAALELWADEPLSILGDWPPGVAERGRLTEVAAELSELRARSLLASGDPAGAAADLRALVELHPLRESLWVLLITALFRGGRQADALAAFQTARRILIDELGIEPSAGLTSAEADVLAGRDPLPDLAPHRSAAPNPTPSAPGPPEPQQVTFVGRESELESLIDHGPSPGPRVDCVWGEAGAGKTALLGQYATWARKAGRRVITSRCMPLAQSPLRPITELVRDLLDSDGLSLGQRTLSDLSILVPDLSETTGTTDHSDAVDSVDSVDELFEASTSSSRRTRRTRVLDAVASLVRTAAGQCPLTILIEDLHWADGEIVEALAHISSSAGDADLQLIVTTRPEDLGSDHPARRWIAESERTLPCTHVELTGLARNEVAELVEALAGEGMSDRVDEIFHITGGNPLFVSEMALAGSLTVEGSAGHLPTRIQHVMDQRLGSCSSGAQRVVTLIAVLAENVSIELLEAIEESDDLLDEVDELVERSLVVETRVGGRPVLQLHHELFRRAVIGGMTATRRCRIHAKAARVLTEGLVRTAEPLGAAAHHWFEAGPSGDRDQALKANEAAAAAALQRTSPSQAIELATRSLEIGAWNGEQLAAERSARLLLLRANGHRLLGNTQAKREDAAAAQQLARGREPRLMATAALVYAGERSTYGVSDEQTNTLLLDSLACVDDRLAQTPHDATLLESRCVLAARMAQETHHGGAHEHAQTEGRANLDLARSAGVEAGLMTSLLGAFIFTINHPDLVDERSDRIDEMLTHAHLSGSPEMLARALIWKCALDLELADGTGLARDIALFDALDPTDLSAELLIRRATLASTVASLAGDLDGAEAAAHQAHALGIAVEPENADQVLQAQLIRPFAERGTLGEMAPLVELMADEFSDVAGWRAAAAFVHSAAGNEDRVNELLDSLVDDAGAIAIPRDLAWHQAVTFAVDAACWAGRTDLGQPLVDQLEPYKGRMVAMWDISVPGANDLWLARACILAGDDGSAAELLDSAEHLNDALGHVPSAARVRLERLRLGAATGELDADEVARERSAAESAGLTAIAAELGALSV